MKDNLERLIETIDNIEIDDSILIKWAAPVIAFGNVLKSKVATIGLNPSNLEFITSDNLELEGDKRRLPTLNSLGLNSWNDVSSKEINKIISSYDNYFYTNPYDAWFKKLDFILSGMDASYYFPLSNACHIDLIPYATFSKWSELKSLHKQKLLRAVGDEIVSIITNSEINILVLNGRSVVSMFSEIFEVTLNEQVMDDWSLKRNGSDHVLGYAFMKKVNSLKGKKLNRNIMIVGYNHNLQSSFGVTSQVMTSIKNWFSSIKVKVNE